MSNVNQHRDTAFCTNPLHDDVVKLKVVQTGVMDHAGTNIIWRRKRCPLCGGLSKTVEVPIDDAQKLFPNHPFKGMY